MATKKTNKTTSSSSASSKSSSKSSSKKKNTNTTIKKFEFSKVLVVAVIAVFVGIAIWSMIEYYILVEMAIKANTSTLPDATLPVTAITTILGVVLSYILYTGSLKCSLNKNKLMDDHGIIKAIFEKVDSSFINENVDKDAEEKEE